MADDNGFRVPRRVKMYSFTREGTFEKGAREDAMYAQLAVGCTLHFKIHDFMYEERFKGEGIFPKDVGVIPEYSLVEMVVNPGDMKVLLSFLCVV